MSISSSSGSETRKCRSRFQLFLNSGLFWSDFLPFERKKEKKRKPGIYTAVELKTFILCIVTHKRLYLCKNKAVVTTGEAANQNMDSHIKNTTYLVVLYCSFSPQNVRSHCIHCWKRAQIILPFHTAKIVLISRGNWFATVGCFMIAKHTLTYSSTILMQCIWFYSAIVFVSLCQVPWKFSHFLTKCQH